MEPESENDKPIMTPKHIKLYELMYQRNLNNHVEVAERLSLPIEQTRNLIADLDGYLKAKLGKITVDRLNYVCPLCLCTHMTDDAEGEFHCPECGYVSSEALSQDDSIPFDQTWAPTTNAHADNALGNTLNAKDQELVQEDNCSMKGKFIAVFQKEKPELAARLLSGEPYVFDAGCAYRLRTDRKERQIVEQTRIVDFKSVATVAFDSLKFRVQKTRLMTAMEDPILEQMLKSATELRKKYHLDGNENHLFKELLGQNIRRAYRLSQALNIKVNRLRLVDTMFYVTLSQCWRSPGKINIAKRTADMVDPRLIELTYKFNKFVENLTKHEGEMRLVMMVREFQEFAETLNTELTLNRGLPFVIQREGAFIQNRP